VKSYLVEKFEKRQLMHNLFPYLHNQPFKDETQTDLFTDSVGNTFHLGYKNQSVLLYGGRIRCLFWDKYKTHK